MQKQTPAQRSPDMQITNASLHRQHAPSLFSFLPSLHLRYVFLAIWKRNGKKGDAKHRNKLSLLSAVDGFGLSVMGGGKKNVRSDKSIYTYSKLHPASQGTRYNGK